LALAGWTLISWTSIASGFTIITIGVLDVCVMQQMSPGWLCTSVHWTNGWLPEPDFAPLELQQRICDTHKHSIFSDKIPPKFTSS